MLGQQVPPPGIPVVNPDGSANLTYYRWWNFIQKMVGNLNGATIAFIVPSWLTVTGSPVQSASGTVTIASADEGPNLFLASPSGSAGPLAPRAIVAADLPSTIIPPPTLTTLGGVFEHVATTNTWLTGITATGATTESTPAIADLTDYVTPTTWTPVDASAAALPLTVNFARYMKIAQEVIAFASITYPGTADTHGAEIGGLPIASSNFANASFAGNGLITSTAPAAGVGLSLQLLGGATAFSIYTDTAGTTTNANLSNRTISVAMRYMVP